MKESNILIAEFIGFTYETNIGWYDNAMSMPQVVYDVKQGNCFEELLFDKSWDWLMPVVEMIKDNSLDEEHLVNIIDDALTDCSLIGTYDAVVEFIKWYNETKD